MDHVSFKINGVEHKVGCDVESTLTLLDFLRERLELRGTKYMCREAGCGACIVATVKCPGGPTLAVNAVEGAFIMGQGYWTCENLVYDKKTGELLSDRAWNLYTPLATDIPQDFRVSFRKKSFGLITLLGAKATGEPPICLAVAIAFALRKAVADARQNSGFSKTNWYNIVGCDVASTLTLVDYLRDTLGYRGTKYMCREAGCGACVVAVVKCPGGPTLSVNACMISITSCQDWEITTIEELGNRKKGYHILQKTLAEYNGTQCGYCTPAWIMNMYSLLEGSSQTTGKAPTMLEVERAFAGNVCRCTGYRPILDAFKKFARDAPKTDQLTDIEDLTICKKTGVACNKTNCDDDDWCVIEAEDNKIIDIKLKDNKCWYKVFSLSSVFRILNQTGYNSYMLVFGNTAKGAYPIDEYPNILIDITSVPELKIIQFDQNLVIGAGLTITEILDCFKTASQKEYFEYLEKFHEHISLVAHVSLRNLGSLAGNLMIKHKHHEFPSDFFLLLETVGAYLTLVDSRGFSRAVSMQQFLQEDMTGKVIVSALLPPLSDDHKLFTYKVMPRSQNAHAIVNAGFAYKLSPTNRVLDVRIVYGGLSPSFSRATNTERFLIGKPLFSNATLQSALQVLKNEIVVVEQPPEPSVQYRKHLALALFYKGLINLCPKDTLHKRYQNDSSKIRVSRPVSDGRQIFDTNPTLWPLNQPIPKIEALIQCAGETFYSDDLVAQPRQVYAAFALTTVALGEILNIDASKALKKPGVIAFYTAKDIPGLNSFTPAGTIFYVADEEVLCSGAVQYFNQPYGIIVAESQPIADAAAKMVTATYKNTRHPVIDIKVTKNDPSRITLNTEINATDRGTDVFKVIKGENTIYGQYHFMMENIACVTRPTEEGLELFCTTQWMDGVQMMVSKALNIDENRIDVNVRRLGGAFGMKISRPSQVAIACSLVTQKLNRPCRFVVPLTTTMRAIGKRLPCHTDFECEVNRSGVIQRINYNLYEDNGYKINETLTVLGIAMFYNCYNNTRWNYKCYDATTDNAKNTWCRSPGSFESISMAEYVMERISYELGLDSYDVRMANLDNTKYSALKEMAENLRTNASYTKRKAAVLKFNSKNRWRKRGIRFSFLRWTPTGGQDFDVNMSVFHGDGTVVITHGAIEMGQGVNTKTVQIAAYLLNIPIAKIQVKPNNTVIAPNGFITGGSIGSQNAGLGVRRCCEELLRRLAPVRSQMTNPTWEQLITAAYDQNVDLQVHGFVNFADTFNYDIFGVALAEVEIDILTGESECLRVDLMQDVGQSVNPEVDVGQVEGAFIMGLGYWTCEDLVYDKKTGELLTNRAWNYNVPLAMDIPQDFRVYFRKKSYSVEPILGAKATGEPPMCLSIVMAFALRDAIAAARQEAGIPTTKWFQIDGPCTVEKVALAASTKIEDFKLT